MPVADQMAYAAAASAAAAYGLGAVQQQQGLLQD
jgi:hypothetical protein